MRHQTVLRTLLLCASLLALQSAFAQVTAVRLNEVLTSNQSYTNADGSVTDLVELYNPTASPLDLVGCSLSDSNAFPRRYVFPSGSVIPAQGFLRLQFDSRYSNTVSSTRVPFGLGAKGGYVFFYGPAANLIDSVEYGLQLTDYSIGRVTDGTGPWVLTSPTFAGTNIPVILGSRLGLKVNEWMASPSSGDDWFEIHNPTNRPVHLGGLYLTDNPTPPNQTKFRIPDLSFIDGGPVNGFSIFIANNASARYPADRVNFALGNNDRLQITDTNGTTVINVIPLPINNSAQDVSVGLLPDGANNLVSFTKINDYETFSRGEPNFLIFTNIYINEVLPHTDPPLEDAIEFVNLTGTNLNISGWWLSNSRANRQKYRIPAGAALPHGGFRVLYEGVGTTTGFNSLTATNPFTFNSARGDQAVLSQVDANGNLTGYIAFEEFESSANGVSFGHYRTSLTDRNDYKFVAMSERTFGADDPSSLSQFRSGTGKTNSYPKVGPVVINELMFHPNINDPGAEEYIELRNITSITVLLYDPQYPTNRWRLQNGVEFTFPLASLGPNQFCLIVPFDPATNAATVSAFRARYGVSNDVPVYGPWSGNLNNGGEAVELYRPDTPQGPGRPDAGLVPYIRVDKVNYSNGNPWPTAANGTGQSLQRKNSQLFGNDPINWAAGTPTPGRSTASEIQDNDGDGIPNEWETRYSFNPNDPADATLDTDGDGVDNLGEYLAGSHPRDASSVLRITQIYRVNETNRAVRFLAYSNATYSVEYRNSLNPNSVWQRLLNVPSAPNTRVVDATDTNAWSKADRYYRVVAPASR